MAMDVFPGSKNLVIEQLINIINDMLEKERVYSEADWKAIREKCPSDVFKAIEAARPYIFTKNEEERYFPAVNRRIPIMPIEAERNSLKMMADDELTGYLMPLDMAERLRGEYIGKDVFDDKYRYSIPDAYKTDGRLRENFFAVAKAILGKRYISYRSDAADNGAHERLRVMPYRFMYSSRANKLQLIAVPENEEKIVHIDLECIADVSVEEDSFDMDIRKLLKEQADTLVLKIRKNFGDKEDKYQNIVDRCFTLFSHLDRVSSYDRKNDTYTINIRYYKFDRKKIIRDILSMGSSVVVMEPEDIRNDIIAELKALVEGNV